MAKVVGECSLDNDYHKADATTAGDVVLEMTDRHNMSVPDSENTVPLSQQSPTAGHSNSGAAALQTAKNAVVETGAHPNPGSTHQDSSEYYHWDAIRVNDRKFVRSLAADLEATELFDFLAPDLAVTDGSIQRVSPRTDDPRYIAILSRALLSKNWQIQNSGVYALQLSAKANPVGLTPLLSGLSHSVALCCSSLRSSVSKNALLCVAHITKGCGTGVPKDFIQLLLPSIISKAAHDKKFVAETAFKAAVALCNANFGCLHEIQFIELGKLAKAKAKDAGAMAKVAEVLSAALSSLYSFLVSRNDAVPGNPPLNTLTANSHYGENLMSPDIIKQHLLPILAVLLTDRLPQTKKAARAAFATLNALWALRMSKGNNTHGISCASTGTVATFTELIHTSLQTSHFDSVQRAALFKGLSDVGNTSPPLLLHTNSSASVTHGTDGAAHQHALLTSLGHFDMDGSGSGPVSRPRRRRAASSTAVSRASGRRSQSLSMVVSAPNKQLQRLVNPLLRPGGEDTAVANEDSSGGVGDLPSGCTLTATGRKVDYEAQQCGLSCTDATTCIDSGGEPFLGTERDDGQQRSFYSFTRRPMLSNLAAVVNSGTASGAVDTTTSECIKPPLRAAPGKVADNSVKGTDNDGQTMNSAATLPVAALQATASDASGSSGAILVSQVHGILTNNGEAEQYTAPEETTAATVIAVPAHNAAADSVDTATNRTTSVVGGTNEHGSTLSYATAVVTNETTDRVGNSVGSGILKPWPQFKSRSISVDPARSKAHHDDVGSIMSSKSSSSYAVIGSSDVGAELQPPLSDRCADVEDGSTAGLRSTATPVDYDPPAPDGGDCGVVSLLGLANKHSSTTGQSGCCELTPVLSQLQEEKRVDIPATSSRGGVAARSTAACRGKDRFDEHLGLFGRGSRHQVDKSFALESGAAVGHSGVHGFRGSPSTANTAATVGRGGAVAVRNVAGTHSTQHLCNSYSSSRHTRSSRWNSSTAIGKVESKYYNGGAAGGRSASVSRLHCHAGGEDNVNRSANGNPKQSSSNSRGLPPVYCQPPPSSNTSNLVVSSATAAPSRRSMSLSKRADIARGHKGGGPVQSSLSATVGCTAKLGATGSSSLSSSSITAIGGGGYRNRSATNNSTIGGSNINRLQTASRKHEAMLLGLGPHRSTAAAAGPRGTTAALVSISPSALSTASAPCKGYAAKTTTTRSTSGKVNSGLFGMGSSSAKPTAKLTAAAGNLMNAGNVGCVTFMRRGSNSDAGSASRVDSSGDAGGRQLLHSQTTAATTPDGEVYDIMSGGVVGVEATLVESKVTGRMRSTSGAKEGLPPSTSTTTAAKSIRNYYLKDLGQDGSSARDHNNHRSGKQLFNADSRSSDRRLLPHNRIPPHPLNVMGSGSSGSVGSTGSNSARRRGGSCASDKLNRRGAGAGEQIATTGGCAITRQRSGTRPVWRNVSKNNAQ